MFAPNTLWGTYKMTTNASDKPAFCILLHSQTDWNENPMHADPAPFTTPNEPMIPLAKSTYQYCRQYSYYEVIIKY